MKKLYYRASRRGTKEICLLLSRFTLDYLSSMTQDDLNVFSQILDFNDVEFNKMAQYLYSRCDNKDILSNITISGVDDKV